MNTTPETSPDPRLARLEERFREDGLAASLHALRHGLSLPRSSREHKLALRELGRLAAQAGSFALVMLAVLALLALAALLDVALALTPFGRHALATGASERVARFSGIRVGRVRFLGYLLTGGLCALSALLFAGRLESISSSNAGLLYELDAIAAVIIGGAAMSGGRGTLRGTLAGVLVLGVVTNILDLWGVNVSLQGCVKGAVIVISVLVQRNARDSRAG